MSATGFTVYDLTNRIVTWHLGSLSPGSTGSQRITVRIPSSLPYDTVLNNTANITTTTKETRYDDNFASALTTLKQAWVPPGVSVSPSIPSPWGSACVDWRSPVLITYNQSYCPEGTPVTIRIKIDDGGPDITGPMTGGPRLWNYSTTFYPRYGAATISLVNEGECTIGGMTFPFYIEPAGYIYDTSSGMRLQGANAYLQWPDEDGNWVNVPTGLLAPPMQPDQNPQVTNSAGQYQWDVVEGTYRVYVEANGYKPNASTMVNSPPAISGLIIGLEPTNGNIGVGSTPAGAQIYLDGSNTGFITPYTLAGIIAGQHRVLLTLAGYQDYNQTVTVTAGKTTTVRGTLEPVSPVATFNASPRAGPYPLSVEFTDSSSGLPPLTYQWSFGDGSPINSEKSPVHVYQSAGKFSVNLTVTNSAGNSTLARPDYIEVSAPQPSEYNLVLGEGWNLVSVPKKLAPGHDTGSIFNNVTTEGRTIWEYEAAINNWVPVYADTQVLPLYGFWIYSKYPATVPLKFDPNPLQVPPSRKLAKGWELIGFSGTIPASARDTLISVRNNWTQAMGFNTTLYQYDIQVINGGSGQFSDERLMHPSKGYWLFMTGPGDLSAIGV